MKYSKVGAYKGMNDFVKLLRAMQVEEDLDALMGVSGAKGMGKSTFSHQIAKRYVEKYMGEKYTVEKYTAYSIDDVFDKIKSLPPFSPLVADEAVNFAMGEDWMKAESKRLKKIFAKVRTKHLLFFFNIPDIWWLDKKYREGMMTLWVHIVHKGKAMVAFPNIAPGIEDRWYKKYLSKVFDRYIVTYFTPAEIIMKKLRKYPCYFDEFAFPKLSEKMYAKHLEIRDKKMLETEDQERFTTPTNVMYKVLPLLVVKYDWERHIQWVEEMKANGGPTVKDIYNHFGYKDRFGITTKTTLDKWLQRVKKAKSMTGQQDIG